ncbi:MAG: flavodoxin family protein [Eubacterium sp.]|nr:flavodoxin family protein [Eubacterium sp.]
MKIIGFYGSPRPQSNSRALVDTVLAAAGEQGADTEVFDLNALDIKGCTACFACHKTPEAFCVQKDDMDQIYAAVKAADAIVIGTPIYMAQASAQTILLLNRLYALMYATDTGASAFKIGPKKVVMIYAQGAPMADHYNTYFDINDGAFAMMLNGEIVKRIVCAKEFSDEELADAREIGHRLACGL